MAKLPSFVNSKNAIIAAVVVLIGMTALAAITFWPEDYSKQQANISVDNTRVDKNDAEDDNETTVTPGPTEDITITPTASPTPPSSPPADNWKKFSHPKIEYTIKYPAEWKLETSEDLNAQPQLYSVIISRDNYKLVYDFELTATFGMHAASCSQEKDFANIGDRIGRIRNRQANQLTYQYVYSHLYSTKTETEEAKKMFPDHQDYYPDETFAEQAFCYYEIPLFVGTNIPMEGSEHNFDALTFPKLVINGSTNKELTNQADEIVKRSAELNGD